MLRYDYSLYLLLLNILGKQIINDYMVKPIKLWGEIIPVCKPQDTADLYRY